MKNISITSKRCKGATTTYRPTICPQRDQCQRHVQLRLDRQLELPDDVAARIPVMQIGRVGGNECHYFVEVES